LLLLFAAFLALLSADVFLLMAGLPRCVGALFLLSWRLAARPRGAAAAA
jgi:hypothetical protein